jgi:hypothetical protein
MDALSRAELIQLVEKYEKELLWLERFPEVDPFEDGQVITFDVENRGFGGIGISPVLNYAGIRIKSGWWLTGQALKNYPAGLSWVQLLGFLRQRNVEDIIVWRKDFWLTSGKIMRNETPENPPDLDNEANVTTLANAIETIETVVRNSRNRGNK